MPDAQDDEAQWSNVRVIIAAIAGAVLLAVLAYGLWQWSGGDRSDYASWLEALATLAAFGAATVAAVFAIRAFRLESNREQQWREDQRRADAALVTAWPSPLSIDHNRARPANLSDDWPAVMAAVVEVSATLQNASQVPVTDVRVKFELVTVDSSGDLQPQTELSSGVTAVQRLDQLAPSGREGVVAGGITPEHPLFLFGEDPGTLRARVAITFRDSANREWHRSSSGELRLLDDPGIA